MPMFGNRTPAEPNRDGRNRLERLADKVRRAARADGHPVDPEGWGIGGRHRPHHPGGQGEERNPNRSRRTN